MPLTAPAAASLPGIGEAGVVVVHHSLPRVCVSRRLEVAPRKVIERAIEGIGELPGTLKRERSTPLLIVCIGVGVHADMFGKSLGAFEAAEFSDSLKLRFHFATSLRSRILGEMYKISKIFLQIWLTFVLIPLRYGLT